MLFCHCHKFSNYFCIHVNWIIQWSSAQKQQQTAREVEERYGIPGVIGFIDGTHIRLASAPGCDKDYYNRKGYPSMQLQVHQYTPNEQIIILDITDTCLIITKM